MKVKAMMQKSPSVKADDKSDDKKMEDKPL